MTGKKIGSYQKPFISGIYNRISRFLFKIPVTDMNSIKIFKRHVMQGIPLRKDWHRYMIVLAVDRGYSVTEIDVTLRARLHGVSKFSGPGRALVGFFDLLAVWFLLAFMKKPMMFFGTMGFFGILSGGLLGIGILIARLVYHWGYPPLQTLVVLLLQLGFTSFIFGALAEMVASLREKVDMLNPTAHEHVTKKSHSTSRKEHKRPDKARSKDFRDTKNIERKRKPDRSPEPAPEKDKSRKFREDYLGDSPKRQDKPRPPKLEDKSPDKKDTPPRNHKKLAVKPEPKSPVIEDEPSFGRGRRKGQAAAPTDKQEGFKLSIDEEKISFGRGRKKKEPQAEDVIKPQDELEMVEAVAESTPKPEEINQPEKDSIPQDRPAESDENENSLDNGVSFGRGNRKTFSVPSEPSNNGKKVNSEDISFGRGRSRK